MGLEDQFGFQDPLESNSELVAKRKQDRLNALHDIEAGNTEAAEIADLISTKVLRRHLETMLRLGIEYDFLPRESEILHLKFWEAAFEKLKQSGVLYFESEGKNKGCWVMTRPTPPGKHSAETQALHDEDGPVGTDEDAKVIVRSNGTVTYVGKDIAYHLWKFGLLGMDFGYKRFFEYPMNHHIAWISTVDGEPGGANWGPGQGFKASGAEFVYNVIDSRQSDPQAIVKEALRAMGYTFQAEHYHHFSYEMVALTLRCAVELGYNVSDEDRSRPYIEVSGRKGFGVKADDLIDKLIDAISVKVDSKNPELETEARARIAKQIAVGALRYFMLKYTRNSVIAFDFDDALSFDGESGPYIQYAIVRARNIFRKAGIEWEGALRGFLEKIDDIDLAHYLSDERDADMWALWLRASRSTQNLSVAVGTGEPAYLARHALQLAQEFNNFYHRHHILTEEDPARKTFLLATAAVALRELVEVLSWLGIESPEAM